MRKMTTFGEIYCNKHYINLLMNYYVPMLKTQTFFETSLTNYNRCQCKIESKTFNFPLVRYTYMYLFHKAIHIYLYNPPKNYLTIRAHLESSSMISRKS